VGSFSTRHVALAALMTTAVIAGCSNDEKAATPSTTTSTSTTSEATTTTGSTEAPVVGPAAPLTGQPAPDASKLGRPALALKIDNSPEALPQSGINNSDMVLEIQVEGISRLMAVFHSQDAEKVGPTRSARYSDPDLLALFVKPLFGWSGANEGVTATVERTPWVKNVNWNVAPKLYYRSSEKRIPHNLFTNTNSLFPLADAGEPAPVPIFDYLSTGESNPGSSPLAGFGLAVGGTNSQWVWDGSQNRYLRWEYNRVHATNSGQAWADNVVILQTRYLKGPIAISTGSGRAWVMTGGTVVEGTWKRDDRTQRYTLTTPEGAPLKLTPGRTWIELPPGAPAAMSPESASGLLAGAK